MNKKLWGGNPKHRVKKIKHVEEADVMMKENEIEALD